MMMLALTLAVCLSGLTMTASQLTNTPQSQSGLIAAERSYGVVVDAGVSTGVHVYSWTARAANDDLPVLSQESSTAVSGSLADMRTSSSLSRFLGQVVEEVESVVPADSLNSTFVLMLGSSGMRQLESDDVDVYTQLVADVKSWMADNTELNFLADEFMTLPAETEAAYGLIGANYALGTLEDFTVGTAYGVVELAEYNSEMSFAVPTEEARWNMTMYGMDIELFTTAFPGYGLSTAYEAAILSLAANVESSTLSFPCLPAGFNDTVVVDGSLYKLEGEGNSATCMELIKDALFTSTDCTEEMCRPSSHSSLATATSTFAATNFYGLSNFEEPLAFFGLDDLSADAMEAAAEEFLGTTYSDLLAANPDESAGFLRYGFDALFIAGLKTDMGFATDESRLSLTKDGKIGVSRGDWPMGAAIAKISTIPAEGVEDLTFSSPASIVAPTVAFAIVALVSLLM